MRHWLPAAFVASVIAAHAAGPGEAWERAVQAKGGRERLHAVHSLAIYLTPAPVNLAGPPTTWLCVFPDRYFEFERVPGRRSSALVVDAATGRAAMDATGMPRSTGHITGGERDRLILNQLVFLLETAWLQPRPVDVRHNVLTVEAGDRSFRLYLDRANLPERIVAVPFPGEKRKLRYDYRLQHYRAFDGIQLPVRVVWIGGLFEFTWDADYDVNAKYNPKFFDRTPDLANGPEPWRK